MSANYQKYFDEFDDVREEAVAENKWLKYLTQTSHIYVNAERIKSVEHVSGRETLLYVMRTLDVLGDILGSKNPKIYLLLSSVLKWSETAKGGNARERRKWTDKGYQLEIHNIASAKIFAEEAKDLSGSLKKEYSECFENDADYFLNLTATLIKTHGLIGQCIRGETPVSHNRELYEISKEEKFGKLLEESGLSAKEFFLILNECIIRAVSPEIWKSVKDEAGALIGRILEGDCSEYSAIYRLENLCPKELQIYKEDADFFEAKVFPKYELWYFTSALSDFDIQQTRVIMTEILKKINESGCDVQHINFKPLSDSLYYDYQGHKQINVYKKRIIEKHIKDASVQNVSLNVRIENGTAFADYEFSKVCEKLIEFCVEAERSGLLSFEKSIVVLYDMFGFRRDAFDRLNNEEKYLRTMNSTENSTKDGIIDYVEGETVVDVGSGGGVLLDRLEKKFPEKRIIGTDISENVIEVLNRKKNKEGHNWEVLVQNFVEGVFPENVDNIIFSSILHEIYSYNETENGRFEIKSVKNALKNAYDSLSENGRIIIRDGIKTEGHDSRMITFKDAAGLEFFENYVRDFEGLKELTDEEKVTSIDREKLQVAGDVNFIREFMYTYTWGIQSYPHEVKEQFGYFTLKEYVDFFESIGAQVLLAKEFLEPGYPNHLSKLLTLTDENGEETEYPASNCILVVKKKN
ncbi:MAG: methyltransferase [Lachnospiraceae bacterium]|nr:methyltransferase [Lachnospiraceae bacterium]